VARGGDEKLTVGLLEPLALLLLLLLLLLRLPAR